MTTWTEERLLAALRAAGAEELERVRFRSNRSTIWSLTASGTALNLHEGYRSAPWSCLRHFATIARRPDRSEPGTRAAVGAVRGWSGLLPALARARRRPRKKGRRGRTREVRPGPCCATPAQLAYLRRLYGRLNRERFQGALPDALPIRLSTRMRTRLGHMRGHVAEGRRYVVEIALSVDLMLEGNGRCRIDTLLHEMAHAADWLVDGGRGHGSSWKTWAGRAGCVPRACTGMAPVRRRAREPVRRVPPLPDAPGAYPSAPHPSAP